MGQVAGSTGNRKITHLLRRNLLVVVVIAFVLSAGLVWMLQSRLAENSCERTMEMNIADVQEEIDQYSDDNLLELTRTVAKLLPSDEMPTSSQLKAVAKQLNVAEISAVGKDGLIKASTDNRFVGFDMSAGDQASEFLVLLDGSTTEFVQAYQEMSFGNGAMRKYAGIATDYGFLQVGHDPDHFQADLEYQVTGCTEYRHILNEGFMIVADANGDVVSNLLGNEGKNLHHLGLGLKGKDEYTRFEVTVYDTRCYCMYGSAEGYLQIAVVPVAEVHSQATIMTLATCGFELLIFIALYLIVLRSTNKLVINDIKKTNVKLHEIVGGNLDAVVPPGATLEFDELSNDINLTVNTLKDHIAAEAARIDNELEVARNIQMGALPKLYRDNEKYQLHAFMLPAKEVGGDFYDFYPIDVTNMAFCVSDVSGKGVPAALFMMMSKALLKGYAEKIIPMGEVFTEVNNRLCAANQADMFVTSWYGVFNPDTGYVHYANAGHNPPALLRAGGQFEFLRSRAGFVLGGMEGINYRTQELTLGVGDVIFLYTDGVTEATNANDELFGDERLLAVLNSDEAAGANAGELCALVKREVDAFVGDAPQFDDITMLCLKRVG